MLLIGQPTLRQRLRLGVLAALDQRIMVRYALAGMSAAETADYLTTASGSLWGRAKSVTFSLVHDEITPLDPAMWEAVTSVAKT